MGIIRKLFSKKKDVPSLEEYMAQVDRISKQADALQRKAMQSYNNTKGGTKHD